MFARLIDGLKESTNNALRLTSLVAILAIALFITVAFLCAAAFISVLQTYGPVEACLTGAGIFLIVALITAALYAFLKNRAREREPEAAKSTLHLALADPVVVATGIQVIRAIGLKKLIPLLAVGGLALGLFASRNHSSDEAPAE
jgi:prepilin signal peptidase PulO-like enzyme (type II secretory pathway)